MEGINPKSSILRLYAKEKEGGQELVSVFVVQDKITKIHEYIRKVPQPILYLVNTSGSHDQKVWQWNNVYSMCNFSFY